MKNLILKNTAMKAFRIFILLFSLSLFSCEGLLDIDAENTISGEVLTDQAAIEEALNGAYYNLMGIYDGTGGGELLGGDFKLFPELLSRRNSNEISWDDVNAPPYSDFIDKDILKTNLRVESNWRRAYEVINTVNSILANIENVENATAKARIQGECQAIRGILYFEMVRLWGPQYEEGGSSLSVATLPLLTEPITEIGEIQTPELATVQQIYTQVETDLTTASSLLESSGKNGTAISYYACQAYLMRVALQKSDFESAETYADNIIESGAFSLVSNPLLAFNNNTNSTEDILAVQQTTANTTGDKSTGTGLANHFSSLTESGLGTMRILEFSLNSSFISGSPLFSDDDIRGIVDYDVDEQTRATEINTAFYTNILNTSTISSSKFMTADKVIPVIRLAEVHLARAEAIFEQTLEIEATALSDLNAIRTRAGLPALQESDFGGDAFAFYDSLVLEKNREFMYEGILFHDLKRRATYLDDLDMANSDPLDDKFILPIPQAETDTWK
ncbi:putative outer membrane starch-binding protein [Marinoscillum sp. 108]|nr:putative outer membrane starch-binding protein [Marinoscillum sp. 108]